MDVFEIIRKYTSGYVSKVGDVGNDNLHTEYEAAKKEVERLEEREVNLRKEIKEKQTSLNDIDIKITEIETAFKNAGGITEKEKKRLEAKYKIAETTKVEATAKIKMFVEGIMPFVIVGDLVEQMKDQLAFEEKGEIYNYISEKLVSDDIKTFFMNEGINDEQMADRMLTMLLSKFKPEVDCKNRSVLFDLSKAELNYAHGMISSIENFDVNEMIRVVNERIQKREAPAFIANDGKQTPMRGHPVFIAQHATATCCRECIRKWHKMQPGRELSQVQQDYLVDIIMTWIQKELERQKKKL